MDVVAAAVLVLVLAERHMAWRDARRRSAAERVWDAAFDAGAWRH